MESLSARMRLNLLQSKTLGYVIFSSSQLFEKEKQKEADCRKDLELMLQDRVQGNGKDSHESISEEQFLIPSRAWD